MTHLLISVGDSSTLLNYVIDEEIVFSHTHPVGFKHIEADGMSKISKSKFIDGIIFTLEFISLYDRIPTDFRLITPRYSSWIGETLENESYSQFFTNGVPISVTLLGTHNPHFSYARHPKTIFSFKV